MATPPKKKRVSELYQKLTQLEHIIKRPDTYIGSVERTEKQLWVYNSEKESMEFREVSYVPGIFKIFDEILVNAADNKANDKNMDELKVTIDREKGEISVWNNGRGIPIEIHSKEKIYIPEMIFGHLLTGSNYDDDQAKVTGGRNGYGAKLCNIFSTQFIVETADARQKKKYKQTWTNNMSEMGKAKITDHKGEDYTKVTFYPDFAKFGMTGIDDDLEALFKRRVYDLAGTCKGVAVKLNGMRVPARNFKKYIEMYTKAIKKERGEEAANDASEIITESTDPRWEIGFTVSDGSFQQVSFVNSIATTSGGTHVNYITDQIVARLTDIVKKKNKVGAAMKPNQIRNHIFLFVNAQIVNPAFTSQTKEQLTTKASQFGSKCQISDDFMKKIVKTEVINNILTFAQAKADQILKKSDGSKRSRMTNPKLVDANKAGTKEGYKCTLILTEGDSAKGLAMAGRSVVGPDLFGVFPLRGKLLNVRDASVEQISKNAEIQNIKTFLGLQHKKVYTDTQGLRYGSLMIMTDQDHDGSHIKGLLINFLQVQFPSLLKIPNFLVEFITPIVKVWKGDIKNPSWSKAFYTLPEYETWKEAHKHDKKKPDHKYLKGLGSSTNEDAQQYFNDIDRHHKEFETMKDEESALLELAFSKKKADERKEWLRQFKPGTYLDMSINKISYTDFVNKELILFSMADNIRSIPSVVDGLKPGQRKVMYACLKKNLKKDVKVAELTGVIGGMTAYHHGEASLQGTIVGLAQNFVGSNNVNLLEPSGQFGTRNQGGSDSASARYIHTRLSPFARKLFHPADDPLLKSQTDDDKIIEPELYVPVLPMVLVNGADGIGTGWSSSIPNYNPEDIVANLKRRMNGEEWLPMVPWFRGFKGEVKSTAPDRFQFSGIIHQTGDTEVEITELPVRTWTQDFKDKLEEIIKAEKVPSFIKDYKDYNTHDAVHFVIQMDEKHMAKAVEEGLIEKFKLTKSIATSNLVAFDPQGRITKYANVEAIMDEFYSYRLQMYAKRKEWLLNDLQRELSRLTNQARFIQMIIDGKLVISKKKKAVLITELQKLGFTPFPKIKDAEESGELEPVVEEEIDESDDDSIDASAYDYLLGMALWSLTQERVEKVRRQIADKEQEVDVLMKKSKEDLWIADLDDFVAEWKFQLEDEHNRKRNIRKGRRVSKKFATAANSKATVKKRKGLGDAFDDSEFEEFAPKAKKRAPAPKPVQRAITAYTAPKSNALKNAMEQRKLYTDGPTDSAAESESIAKEIIELPEKAPKPVARGGRGKKPTKYTIDSDSESDFNNSTDGFEDESKKSTKSNSVDLSDLDEVISKPRPRAVAIRKQPQLDDDLDSDLDRTATAPKSHDNVEDVTNVMDASDVDEEVIPKPKSRAARPVAKKPAKAIISDDEDETELPPKTNGKTSDVDMSDADEVILKPKSRAARPAARKPVQALISDDEDETENPPMTNGNASDMSDFDEVIPKPKSRGARTAPKKAAKPADSDMDDDDDIAVNTKSKPSAADESDFEEVIPKPKARATKAPTKKATKATKAKNDSDDDDVVTKPAPKKTTKKKAVEQSDADEPVTKPKARAPRANAKKTPAYTLDTDSDNGDDLLADLGDMVKGLPKTALKDTQPKEKKPVAKKPVAAAKKLEQSPIAKAYAKRLAKKKVVESDDDMDMTF
ncbi:DNA topoisomerase 2 [Exophiala bonariae]|uniref:DNA topoisomerase 2 n=1 Tax=Exophiala bonariae TaxID=1690606 RepID=A0AAV9MTU2_9EURO|nr:DNA topoisomerase 2 [Exophiala bonariae]